MMKNIFKKQPKLRKIVKNLLLDFLCFPYAFNNPQNTILMYHSIKKSQSSLSVSPEEFEKQMIFLKSNNFNFLTINDLSSIKTKSFKKSVMITFDDGLDDIYHNAVPILKKYKIPAIFFISTGLVGNKFIRDEYNCMSWEQIKEIDDDELFEIGSHAITHKKLVSLSTQEIKDEVLVSKKNLEDKLGHPVRVFAAPFGKYNNVVLRYIQDGGYKYAFSTKPAHLSENYLDFEISRLGIDMFISHKFPSVFKGGYAKFLKFSKKVLL